MNPFFILTLFDSDNSNLAMYNMNQPYIPDWFVRLNMTRIPNSTIKIFKIIFTLHRVNRDYLPQVKFSATLSTIFFLIVCFT